MKKTLLICIAAAAILLAGCGSGGASSGGPTGGNGGAQNIISIQQDEGSFEQSGSFRAGEGQVLELRIESTIEDGYAEFYLYDPDDDEGFGTTIENTTQTREIELFEGNWTFVCSGEIGEGSLIITGSIR